MPGDPELDLWLAKNLMGWHELVDPEVPHPKIIVYRDGPTHDGPCEVYKFDEEYGAELLVSSCDYVKFDSWGDIEWVPTERIWHTQQVWEKMREKDLHLKIRVFPNEYGAKYTEDRTGYILARSLEVAVCIAAKGALESDYEDCPNPECEWVRRIGTACLNCGSKEDK